MAEKKMFDDKQRAGLVAAGASLLAGLVLAGFLKLFGVDDSAVFVALIFFPLFVYMIFSDKVSEITGPGGWGAKFRDMAEAEVVVESINPDAEVEVQSLDIVAKSSVRALEHRGDTLGKKPVAMTLQLGRQNHYHPEAIRTYLRALLARDDRLMVIFIDAGNRFVAATRGRELLNALDVDSGEPLSHRLISAIESNDLSPLEQNLGMTHARLRRNDSNAAALKLMLDNKVEELVVTDETDRPAGIVRRDDIMARLLANMASR